MLANPVPLHRASPRAWANAAVAGISLHAINLDTPGVLLPRPETQIVVRFGLMAGNGMDVSALGARQRVHRKLIRAGQQTLIARLRLGVDRAILGTPASTIAGQVVTLEDLWGTDAARLIDQLAGARDMGAAAATLVSAISQRLATADAPTEGSRFVLEAAKRLENGRVDAVASDLGVSTRHLRRVFREALGVSPKAFARLERFRRALRVSRENAQAGWADVAAGAGYYDQAHLIAEFRAIAGVTPSALVRELSAGPAIG
jgi:AraC-like DNA-binding protein